MVKIFVFYRSGLKLSLNMRYYVRSIFAPMAQSICRFSSGRYLPKRQSIFARKARVNADLKYHIYVYIRNFQFLTIGKDNIQIEISVFDENGHSSAILFRQVLHALHAVTVEPLVVFSGLRQSALKLGNDRAIIIDVKRRNTRLFFDF